MPNTSVVLLLIVAAACTAKQPASQSDSTASPAATATASGAVPVTSTEPPIAPEGNPPGDIPDTQAFVRFSSTSGYSIEIPEGWARTGNGASVTFISNLDGVRVDVVASPSAPMAAGTGTTEARQIQAQGRAVSITSTSDVTLPSGKAVLITYESNSEPNPVTQKQVRLTNEAYVMFGNGKRALVTFWAPKGADNADQWNRMSRSFRWQ